MNLINQKNQDLTLMPSKNFDLPHVIPRIDKNGIRLYFAPQKNLPHTWFKKIKTLDKKTGIEREELRKVQYRIPINEADQQLDPKSKQFEIAVRRDHNYYLDKLEKDRCGIINPKYREYSLVWLFDDWMNESGKNSHWNTIVDKTRRSYLSHYNNIHAFSETLGHAHVKDITPEDLIGFRDDGGLKDSMVKAAMRILSILFSRAVLKRAIPSNPIKDLGRFKKPKTQKKKPIVLWTPKDVEDYIKAANEIGWQGGAILTLGMWESMFRITDVLSWKKNDFIGNVIYLETSKTDETAYAYMSSRFMEMISKVKALYCVTQRQNGSRIYNPTISDERQLGRDIERLQAKVIENGGRRLLLKHLRHSASTHAQLCGVSKELIRVNTAHVDDAMLDQVYVQDTADKAELIAKARGIA